MSSWLTLVPITALVAVLVFIFKEIFEYVRRRSGDRRKMRALTALLARECELNYWTVKALRTIFSEVHTTENPNPQTKVTVERTRSGRPYANIVFDESRTETHAPIPVVHRELMSKFLLDVAMLDRKLFEAMEPAYDSLATVEHVRESLVNVQDAPQYIGEEGFLEGLAGYALNELRDAEAALGVLYQHCTGSELKKHRLR